MTSRARQQAEANIVRHKKGGMHSPGDEAMPQTIRENGIKVTAKVLKEVFKKK